MIYGNHSIVSDQSAVLNNKLKTKGKKMQKTEFIEFWLLSNDF